MLSSKVKGDLPRGKQEAGHSCLCLVAEEEDLEAVFVLLPVF